MKRSMLNFALSTFLGMGVATAAPQAVQPSAAAPQEQSATPNDSQTPHHHRADPNRQAKFLSKKLNLSPDQTNQIVPILADRNAQMETLRADTSLSRSDRRAKVRGIQEDTDAKISAVLNDSQKQAYQQLKEEMRERSQHRREQRQEGSATRSGDAS